MFPVRLRYPFEMKIYCFISGHTLPASTVLKSPSPLSKVEDNKESLTSVQCWGTSQGGGRSSLTLCLCTVSTGRRFRRSLRWLQSLVIKDPHLKNLDIIFKVNRISGENRKLLLLTGESGRRKYGRMKFQETA